MTAMEKKDKNLNVPNLRFPEFSGEWDNGTLQSVATLSKGTGISKDQLSEEGHPCILYGELYTKYKKAIIDCVVSRTNIKTNILSKKGGVLVPATTTADAYGIAIGRAISEDNIEIGGDMFKAVVKLPLI